MIEGELIGLIAQCKCFIILIAKMTKMRKGYKQKGLSAENFD